MEQLTLFDSSVQPSETTSTTWDLYVDGAARNNPGPAGAGLYLVKNGEPYLKKGFYLGMMTNNQAEYTALLLGFFFIEAVWHASDELHIFSDSQLMIRQLKGEYKVKEPLLKKLHGCGLSFLQAKKHRLNHIVRENNKIADKLANQGIDKLIAVPDEFQSFCIRY